MSNEYPPTRQAEFEYIYAEAVESQHTNSVTPELVEKVDKAIEDLQIIQVTKYAHDVYDYQLKQLMKIYWQIQLPDEDQDDLEDEETDILEDEETDVLEEEETDILEQEDLKRSDFDDFSDWMQYLESEYEKKRNNE